MESDTPQPKPSSKFSGFLHQHVKPFVFVVLILCTFRSTIADWNDVPTGSMNPSIIEGDRIFVNKLAYDLKVPFTTWHVAEWSQPKRGDVVVFYSPTDGTRLVKRVIGLPGDTLSMVNKQLRVNGEPATYGPLEPQFAAAMVGRQTGEFSREQVGGMSHPVMTFPLAANRPNIDTTVIPEGQYYMMGDNRDNSSDSRYWGFVPRSQIVGRASAVVISLDPDRSYFPRWSRFFTSLP
jgi:signal peptidase I